MSIERKLKNIFGDPATSKEEKSAIYTTLETGGDRNFLFYLGCFGLKPEDIRGKTNLDIGSAAGMFAKEAKKEGIDVIPLDKNYSFKSGRMYFDNERLFPWLKRILSFQKKDFPRAIAGLAKNLPFQSNAFDSVFCLYSVFSYLENKEDAKAALGEILRVLAKGGKLFIYPIGNRENEKDFSLKFSYEHPGRDQEISEAFFSFIDKLETEGIIKKKIGPPTISRQIQEEFGETDLFEKKHLVIEKI